ncbi:DUF2982 domain-containing protein [Motilimonas pumila]|uniref:DUF2982 domain-containing protein n=1 Tax=Motilimonas pumila TaxID=2303987 RepID=A0A418YD05_9GAMM|nr:DUF2982 domain-containing protein [Motilimonas pumila]RJG42408.1 DUF2982 domain-containing protein [Motilimonas pumila]
MEQLTTVNITPLNKRHANTMVYGSLILILVLMGAYPLLKTVWAIYILLLPTFILFFIIGCGKLMEPDPSLTIAPARMTWHSNRGDVVLNWSDIHHFGMPAGSRASGHAPLNLIGIQLHRIEALLDAIPLRACNLIIHQHRNLMMAIALDESIKEAQAVDESVLNDKFQGNNGELYTGLKASLAHRLLHTKKLTGYHMFIPANCLDRDIEAFLPLLKDYHLQAVAQKE